MQGVSSTTPAQSSETAALVEHLAERLCAKMAHLDPVDEPPWSEMNESDREFYRTCAEMLLAEIRHYDRLRRDMPARP